MNNYIEILEELNEEYIINKFFGGSGKRKKLYSIKDIYEILRRRILFSNIRQAYAQENLPDFQKKQLAKMGNQEKKVVVYTCITGKYDNLKPPILELENIDYILYSDKVKCDKWVTVKIGEVHKDYNLSMINRYYKFHPHKLFADKYDYSIYIDGNIQPVTDLSVLCELVNSKYGLAFHAHCSRKCVFEEAKACIAQRKGNSRHIKQIIKEYHEQSFPKDFGMVEGNVIVTDLKNLKAREILDFIWEELINSSAGRDQLIIPYVFWKMGIDIDEVATLGKNVYLNPKLRISRHS